MHNWARDLMTEAQQEDVLKEGQRGIKTGKELFRVYYIGPDGNYGHLVMYSELEFTNVYETDVDVKATIKRAKAKVQEKAPAGTTFLDIEKAKENKKSKKEVME